MSAFIAPPPPKQPRIPAITIRELINAMTLYLPTVIEYSHAYDKVESDRTEMSTSIAMYGQFIPQFEFKGVKISDVRQKVLIVINDRAAKTASAKLWSEPFTVGVHIPYRNMHFDVIIEPRPDRSIAIRKVARWEHGKPIYVDPSEPVATLEDFRQIGSEFGSNCARAIREALASGIQKKAVWQYHTETVIPQKRIELSSMGASDEEILVYLKASMDTMKRLLGELAGEFPPNP